MIDTLGCVCHSPFPGLLDVNVFEGEKFLDLIEILFVRDQIVGK